MIYTPITPFGRPVNFVHSGSRAPVSAEKTVDKWEVLKTLATAKERYALSDRDLSVLQALISFHPGAELKVNCSSQPLVHPSNEAICTRLNGMPCSTMRRHLNRLISVGLLLRRDSPNGKRFTRGTGTARHVFGFDLSPLVLRSGEFAALATEVEADLEQACAVRLSIMLMRRDLTALVETCPDEILSSSEREDLVQFGWNVTRLLRRKLSLSALSSLETDLAGRLTTVKGRLQILNAPTLSSNDAHSEHHYHNQKKEYLDSDSPEIQPCADEVPCTNDQETSSANVSLGQVLRTCSAIKSYATDEIRTWDELLRTAETVRPMMGVSMSVWLEAKRNMGGFHAASLLTAMLERFDGIQSPSAYMRFLSLKSRHGSFSVAGMLASINRAAELRCRHQPTS